MHIYTLLELRLFVSLDRGLLTPKSIGVIYSSVQLCFEVQKQKAKRKVSTYHPDKQDYDAVDEAAGGNTYVS
jgi:hypothetical protein